MSADNPWESSEDELYEHHRFVAAAGQQPLRVDRFLMNFLDQVTRNRIQRAAKAGNIWVNGQAVKPNYKVKAGDVVKILFEHPPNVFEVNPEPLDLDIVYEDESLIVVNKAAGMVVHPGPGNYSGTLLNGLMHHLEEMPLNSDNRPGLVHRIDKDTSGLLVVAKTEHALSYLAKQFFEKTTARKYIALVWGQLEDEAGTIEGAIGRNPNNRLLMQVFPEGELGKEAITHYKVLERMRYVSLVECQLETGRTHQIRVHMKHIGHPLFNDARYGGDKILKGTTFSKYKQFVENAFKILPRQALHAQTLGFIHPKTLKPMEFQSELPEDMATGIAKWRDYANYLETT